MKTRFKIPTLALFALFCSSMLAQQFRLQIKTRTVYIVPMANGLDRYLASRITSTGAVWVVLDPVNADAIITDRVDEAFWAWSNETHKPGRTGPIPTLKDEDRTQHAGSNRGTVFLVDPKTGVVLWSTYEPVANASPSALDQTADRVAVSLKKHLNAK